MIWSPLGFAAALFFAFKSTCDFPALLLALLTMAALCFRHTSLTGVLKKAPLPLESLAFDAAVEASFFVNFQM